MRPARTTQAETKAPVTAAVPTQPARGSPIRRPKVTRTRNPARGNNSMRYATWTMFDQPRSESRSSATVVARRR